MEGTAKNSRDVSGRNPRVSDHAEGAHPFQRHSRDRPCLRIPICHFAGAALLLHIHLPPQLYYSSQLDNVSASGMLHVS